MFCMIFIYFSLMFGKNFIMFTIFDVNAYVLSCHLFKFFNIVPVGCSIFLEYLVLKKKFMNVCTFFQSFYVLLN